MAATPKGKECNYLKRKKREELSGFNHEFFYYNALYLGYNLTNALHDTIKAVKEVWGLAPRKILQIHFLQCWIMPLRKFPELHTRTLEEPFGGGL